jgi:hypothetical protein
MVGVTIDAVEKGHDGLRIILTPKIARYLADMLNSGADRFEKETGKDATFLLEYECKFVHCIQEGTT